MPKIYIATYRLLIQQEIIANSLEEGRKLAEATGRSAYQSDPTIKYVELAKVEEKEITPEGLSL